MNNIVHKIKKDYVLNLLDVMFIHYFLDNTNINDTPDNRKKIENNGLLSVGFYELKNILNNNHNSTHLDVPENLIVFSLMSLEENIAVKHNLIKKPSSIYFDNINVDEYFSSIKKLIKNNKFPDYFYPLSELVGFQKNIL